MCVDCKSIYHRSNYWHPMVHPLKMNVPCGKCLDCQRQYQDEWFTRCFYEWQDCVKHHGVCYFLTLTYNEDSIPYYQGHKCFSKRHVQLFIKRLRYRLNRYGLTMKYFIASEYGELFQRPHYHALFYLNYQYLTPSAFQILVEESWQYGFIKKGKFGIVVQSYHAVKYVTKYVTKDIAFAAATDRYSNLIDSRYSSLYHGLLKRYPHVSIDVDDFYEKVAVKKRALLGQICPFHLQSTNLGLFLLDSLSETDIRLEQCHVPSSKGIRSARLPRYFIRKLFYDRAENDIDGKMTLFVLNTRGKFHKMELLDERIKDLTEKLRLFALIPAEQHGYTGVFDKFSSSDEAKFFFNNCVGDAYEFLAKYMLVYRGMVFFYQHDTDNGIGGVRIRYKLDDFTRSYFDEKYKDFYRTRFFRPDDDKEFYQVYHKSEHEKYDKFIAFLHPVFVGLEDCAKIYEFFTSYEKKCNLEIHHRKEMLARKAKQAIRLRNYKLKNPNYHEKRNSENSD